MTQNEFLALPSREQDALVAEHVTKDTALYCSRQEEGGVGCGSEYRDCEGAWSEGRVKYYTTDIAAAWDVVNEMHVKGWDFSYEDFIGGGENGRTYRALFNESIAQENGHLVF